MNAHSTSLLMPLPCWARRLLFLVAAICSLFAIPNLRASVYEVGTPGYITHVVVEAEYFYGSNYNSYSNYWTENYVLGESDSLYIYDTYEEHGWGDNWYVEAYFYNSYSWTEPIFEDPPPSGGEGPPPPEYVDPWADVDEDGVGAVEPFALADRGSSLPSGAEWLGMAVGIFVEPVDWVMTAVEIYRDPTNPWSYVGLIPGVPSGVGKMVKASVNIASDILRNLPLGKVLKLGDKGNGMQHILMNHAHNSPKPGKSKFNAGMGQYEIANLLKDALDQPGGVWRDEGWADVYEVVMPNVIGMGVDQQTLVSAATRKLRIVVKKADNSIQNAYPIPE